MHIKQDDEHNLYDPASDEAFERALYAERRLKEKVAHARIKGASNIDNFRGPDFFVFLLFEKCSGVHTIDFVEYEQRDFQAQISFPGQIHSWSAGPATSGQKLLVSRELLALWPTPGRFSVHNVNRFPILDLTPEDFYELEYEFTQVAKGLLSSASQLEINIRLQLIITLLDKQVEKYEQEESVRKPFHPLVQKFRQLVQNHFKEERLLIYYAAQLNVTPNYLNILCRKHLGQSATGIIHQRLLLEAKRLLLGSDLRVKEITYELGFPDMAAFSNFIRAKTGLSPREIRKRSAPD